jgi:RHS repeat-associated protein
MTVVTTEQSPCSASSPAAGRPPSTRAYCRKHAFARFSPNVSPGTQVQGCSPSSRHVSYDLHRSLAVERSVGRYYDPQTGQFLSVGPAVDNTGQPYSYANDDPINENDPLGLGCGAFGFVCNHWRGIVTGVGLVAGVAAAATGVGAIVEVAGGSAVLGLGLGLGSIGAGALATGIDAGPCLNGGDTPACIGFGFGLGGPLLGGVGTGGSALVLLGVIGDESLGAAVLGGVGAFGLNLGLAGTAVDIANALIPAWASGTPSGGSSEQCGSR